MVFFLTLQFPSHLQFVYSCNLLISFFRLFEMYANAFDPEFDSQQNGPINARSQRIAKGINSQNAYHNEYLSLVKEAASKRWVFHMPGDDVSFNFQYNNCRWPKSMSVAAKLDLKPGDSVLLKFGEITDYAYLSAIVEAKDLMVVEKVVHDKLKERTRAQPDVMLKHGSFIEYVEFFLQFQLFVKLLTCKLKKSKFLKNIFLPKNFNPFFTSIFLCLSGLEIVTVTKKMLHVLKMKTGKMLEALQL